MRRKALKIRQAPRRLAQSRISLLRNISDSRAFQKIIHRRAGVCMRETARRQYSVCAHTVVSHTEGCIAAYQNLTGVLELRQERKWLAYLYLQVFWSVLIHKINGLIHTSRQYNAACSLCVFKDGATKSLSPIRQCR